MTKTCALCKSLATLAPRISLNGYAMCLSVTLAHFRTGQFINYRMRLIYLVIRIELAGVRR